jgi:hypothetical protein
MTKRGERALAELKGGLYMAPGSKERTEEACTACVCEQGCGEPRAVAGAEEAYGPYAGAIRERVASCADYLGRISRQLDAKPSRHYVAEKAHALRDAAGRLIGLCHDVEGWLRQCGEAIHREDGDETWTEECVLPTGHYRDHWAHPPRTTLELARDLAGKVAEASLEISDHLGWIAHDPGRLGDPYDVEALGRSHEALRRGVERLSPALAALRAEGLTCSECEFQAKSFGQLEGHKQEAGH